MSAEEGSTQPPAAGSDKAPPQSSKPAPAAAFTSSFINKNTTGKKFAPKAARRRPAAAAAPEPTPPVVEAQSTQPEAESSIAAEEPAAAAAAAAAAQLPTPLATQENSTQQVQDPSSAATEPPVVQQPTPPSPGEPLPTLAASSTEVPVRADEHADASPTVGVPSQEDADTGRATKRRRVESPVVEAETVVAEPPQPQPTLPEPEEPAQPEAEAVVGDASQEDATQVADEDSAIALQPTDATQADTNEPAAPPPLATRVLPWAAVNRPAEVEDGDVAPVAPKKARQPPRPRGRKKATVETENEPEEHGEQDAGGDGQVGLAPKRPSAKGRGKRKTDAATAEDGAEETAPAPAKRARKPRKAKNNDGVAGDEAGPEEGEEQAEEGQDLAVRRKPRQPRRRKQTATEGGNEENAQPKRKGRPPREPTPEDAEDHQIDPENTYMDNIASRNIRVGKLSTREKAMREIDWVAVKQRQREEDARPVSTKEAREAAEKLLVEQAPQDTGPRFEVVDGQIQMTHASSTLNREAQADREIQNYEVVEERDLTTRITSRSFMKNNKRFPNDFILPGQGKRWSLEDTDRFYEGLRHFGTDFQMMSHMFPGYTRRSIKLKFTREERDNPDGIREILLSRSTIDSHWDKFMEVSQMEEDKFADADTIKREMAAHEAEMREKIKAAKAETEERKRQQREAGLLDDENGDDPNKENGKGKKKRKGKEKQVTFQEEAGVEILGNVDDDETWGQE
ncbi:hypothetical protein DE146DRAFT_318397 [Phaeosphaeria sp. MPI-PUGE-AT-0046c]|nr:hypothetical protein DE146DRAFT_318397 [Phaeosphaeria sp. MPI-PUGE-AT-0046c]